MSKIYLDHSATTPVDKRVIKEMEPYWKDKFGNPTSVHKFGQKAVAGVDQARKRVADFLNCRTDEVIFTSGATESDNLVIQGVIKALRKQENKKTGPKNCMDLGPEDAAPKTDWKDWFRSAKRSAEKEEPLHIITTSIEHKAVLEPCAEMEGRDVEVTYLPVNEKGIIDPEELKNSIKSNTVLVSVMYVNSEVGSVQPVKEVGKMIKKVNEHRFREWQKWGAKKKLPKPQKVYFHTDATQALNFYNCDVQGLRADFLSLSAHKIYGPKGVGALFIRQGSQLKPVQVGGGQERGLRSGTLNSTGIVGLGKAVSLLTPDRQKENNRRIAGLRDKLVQGIRDNISDAHLTTDRKEATPSHAHFIFPGAEGEAVLIALDQEGVAVSVGSACSSRDVHPSHVLNAMGVEADKAKCAIRFTLGKKTTKKEINKVLEVLPGIIDRVRKMSKQ